MVSAIAASIVFGLPEKSISGTRRAWRCGRQGRRLRPPRPGWRIVIADACLVYPCEDMVVRERVDVRAVGHARPERSRRDVREARRDADRDRSRVTDRRRARHDHPRETVSTWTPASEFGTSLRPASPCEYLDDRLPGGLTATPLPTMPGALRALPARGRSCTAIALVEQRRGRVRTEHDPRRGLPRRRGSERGRDEHDSPSTT